MRFYPSRWWIALILAGIFPSLIFAQTESVTNSKVQETAPAVPAAPAAQAGPNLFVENFFMRPNLKAKYQTWESQGYVFLETPGAEGQARYSIVTDFSDKILKTQALHGFEKNEDVRQWIKDKTELANFQGVEVRRLPIPVEQGEPKTLYWVGNKSFDSSEKASAQIALVQSIVEAQGGNFQAMVEQAKSYLQGPEEPPPVEIKTPAQYQKEEEIMLKFLDQLDVGNEMFGPFQGVGMGENPMWQAFGETTWRQTNLTKQHFNSQVGFFTNRFVFKGIRAPLSTVDPFVEVTTAMESDGNDAGSHLDLSGGLEWRPLSRNAWLYNFRPWSFPLLEWVRNTRFYVQYFNRENLKNEIVNAKNYDFQGGVSYYYEWGTDLSNFSSKRPSNLVNLLYDYVWGEYFGNYRYERTDFGSLKIFNAFLFNSSLTVGFKTPAIPLPQNPINDQFILMPYFRFEHTNNSGFSFPYQNYYFVAAGLRWMPFSNYRFQDNEWLSKIKIFAEYDGIGRTQYWKEREKPALANNDLRFGISISERRF